MLALAGSAALAAPPDGKGQPRATEEKQAGQPENPNGFGTVVSQKACHYHDVGEHSHWISTFSATAHWPGLSERLVRSQVKQNPSVFDRSFSQTSLLSVYSRPIKTANSGFCAFHVAIAAASTRSS